MFGGGGDDWVEGGNGNDLLQGDSGAPFFDDIMVAGPGIERNHGTRGYDWAIHARSNDPGDSDLNIHINAAPGQLADRFLLTEALSGWDKDDDLKGDNWVPIEQDVELHAPWGSNALTEEGIDRIAGLRPLLAGHIKCVVDPQLPGDEGEGGPPATGEPIRVCGFGEGNVILGGGGSDTIRGRGANDIIDGDAWLNVRLLASYPDGSTKSATEMRELQPDVFAGKLNPGSIQIVREILTTGPAGTDTAVYAGPLADYDISTDAGVLTVTHARNQLVAGDDDQGVGFIGDGADTLRNIEKLQFSDQTITVRAPAAPTIGNATAGNASATVRWTAPDNAGRAPISGYDVLAYAGTATDPVRTVTAAANATQVVVTGLANGTSYTFEVRARNALFGAGPLSAASNAVTPRTVPGAPTIGVPSRGNTSATVRWTAPANNGGSAVTGYEVQRFLGTGATVQQRYTAPGNATSLNVTGLANGTSYTFRVVALNAAGRSIQSARSAAVTPATVPAAPGIIAPLPGAVGGGISATAVWSAPADNGGSAVTGYRVYAIRILANGTDGATTTSTVRPATARSYSFPLTAAGNYRFQVVAINAVGTGPRSARSAVVAAR